MTVEQFGDQVKEWLATAKHPRFKRPYTELVYQADASSGNQAPDGDEMTPDDARNGESVKARRPMVRQHEALRSSVAGATEACSRSGRSNSLRMACL
jgi:hypothetical protein